MIQQNLTTHDETKDRGITIFDETEASECCFLILFKYMLYIIFNRDLIQLIAFSLQLC